MAERTFVVEFPDVLVKIRVSSLTITELERPSLCSQERVRISFPHAEVTTMQVADVLDRQVC